MFGIQKKENGPGHNTGATLFGQAQAGVGERQLEIHIDDN